jgi:hypothetical protein
MIQNSRLWTLFSILLFLLMTSFTVSSYALPCHDSYEVETEIGLSSVDNVDFIALDSLSIVQNGNDCENCIGICYLCKSHIQSQPVLGYTEGKSQSGFYDYKNYSLLTIPEIIPITRKVAYKLKHLYGFSLLSSLQTTLKHRILLV